MNVSLTPELEAMVQAKVKSGKYNSASEVVREGLRLIQERDVVLEARLEELRGKIQVGLDQLARGEKSRYESPEAFFEEMDAMAAPRR